MELNSLTFILLFMPVAVLLMYFIKDNEKLNIAILFLNAAFYLMGDYRNFIYLMAVCLVTVLFSKRVKNNKGTYFLYLAFVLFELFFFKSKGLFSIERLSAENLIMPLGLSYYTFNAISYVSDIHYGKYEPCEEPIEVFTYLTFFPVITSGPLLRFKSFDEFYKKKEINTDNIAEGLRRFVLGLFKKTVIGSQLSVLTSACFSVSTKLSAPLAWAGLVGFALRLYFDFSGYSDMALGVGRMMGFVNLPENFNEPYASLSISDFWRRWHMSLGSWFRDYIYIPLGGNRVNTGRWIINIMAVWLATGLWHGVKPNFIIWGVYNGILLLIDKKLLSKIKLPKIISWLITMCFVLVGWVMFNAGSVEEILRYLSALVFKGEAFSMTYVRMLDILYLWPIYILGLIMCIPAVSRGLKTLNEKHGTVYDILLLVMGIISLVFILGGSQVTSIYFRF